ncbi:MAG: hypothetical protein ACRD03_06245 [Acidimicrobiales bacterium]
MRPTRARPSPPRGRPRLIRTAAGLALAWAWASAGCGGDGDGGASPASTSAPVVGPTARTEPGMTTLSDTATCSDYLGATRPARENATRAALIVVRYEAGVDREPSREVREGFEEAVDAACGQRPSAPMLEVMAGVAGEDRDAYLG